MLSDAYPPARYVPTGGAGRFAVPFATVRAAVQELETHAGLVACQFDAPTAGPWQGRPDKVAARLRHRFAAVFV